MRAPIYLSDLESQKGFKRIAKQLTRDWSGLHPVTLSKARELLARGFGYANYHDVTKSAKAHASDAYAPSAAEVRNSIKNAINGAAHADPALTILSANLQQLVQSLPLTSLVALNPQSANVSTQLQPQPILTNDASNNLAPTLKAQSADVPAGSEMSPLMSTAELRSIVRVVEESGSLRDMALLAFLMTGLRSNEFREIKVSQVSITPAQASGAPGLRPKPSRVLTLINHAVLRLSRFYRLKAVSCRCPLRQLFNHT
ncbi:hypothetical protein HX810_03335 [Pseudomonas salomonii]|uniref:Uncharacterized protein n=1 Tax=Pseudomonas salomonii TaxID=191391 RepID=A0A7Y8GAA0_9PSED|nr:hypothetical protein [Pseudomonas salomonii]NWF06707.1 hypothetical protein [Pseudomonas salomonii]